ncbi:MAG: protein kinase, partial [bacterium]|nr:protein kinase [bacterium]
MPFEPVDRIRGSEAALVYKGKDPKDPREALVKIFKEPYGIHEGFVNECENVANHLRTIKHPNIVPVWEVGRHSDRMKIATEMMPMSLKEYLVENESVDLTSALSVTLKVIEALETGYKEGLEPHLAIKPNNILVNDELTNVKLSDWYVGRAMEMMDSEHRIKWEDSRFISPEQIHRIGELTQTADIYSVGMVLYNMLTGYPLFHDDDDQKVRYQQVYTNATPHIEYYKQIPAAVKEILITALQKNPGKRYSSMTEFKEAVAYALAAVSFKKARPEGSLAGQIVDKRYEVLEELGTGQFSDLYKALEKGRDKFVAIKFYDEKLSGEEGFIRAINKDMYQRAQLKHPHVVDLIAQGWHGNRYYTVESYVPSSLEGVLAEREKLSPEQALKIIRKVIAVLSYLHTKEVMQAHGALKPGHILINPHGEDIFLKDFRLPETERFIRETYGVPPTGYHYASPEIWIDDPDSPIDGRSDIYSLGCILYRLVTGGELFDGTIQEIMEAHIETEALPIIQQHFEIPLVFHDIMIKMLEKDPLHRYQTYDALAEDIDNLIGGADSGINIHLIDHGTTIKGKYQLDERLLNIGGLHGPSPEKDLVLYSGIHLGTETPVMLWFYRIPKSKALDEAWNERMEQASHYDHTGLIRVLDYGRDKGAYFFVSELRNQTIADYVAENGPISEMQAVDIAKQVAEALQYLKASGFEVYGRVSPESVFLVAKPQMKAKLSGFERDVFYDTPLKLNRAEYLSPEQITGLGEVTLASDIYTWGLLLYFMITGEDLFHGEPHEIAGMHVFLDPKEKLEAAPVTADLKRILERALKKDYMSRHATWHDVIEELDDYQASLEGAGIEEKNLSFIPGTISYLSIVDTSEKKIESMDEVRMTLQMRFPPSNIGVRGAFGVSSGIGANLEEALRCADLAMREAEKVFSYSSLGQLDILENPNQLAINAMQRANGVVNQEAFRLNKVGSIGAEMLIATVSQNRLFLSRVGTGFAYILRSATIRGFMRRSIEKRMLGRDLTVQVETADRHLRAGDVLILGTSDLGRVLSDVELRNCVTSTIDTQEACERIISLASSRYKGAGSSIKEGMACAVVQFGEISDQIGALAGRFPAGPVIHHYVTKGTAYLEEKMYDKAIAEFLKGLEIKPDSFSVNFQLSQAFKGKGQLELALKHCQKALDLFPGFAEGHAKMGDILYERGNKDRALEEYEVGVATAPNSADAHIAIGSYYFREALYTQALMEFRKAAELDPMNEQAKANLQMAQSRAKSITGAVAEGASKVKHGIRRP